MVVSQKYRGGAEASTPEFKYPLKVNVEYKWGTKKFHINFEDSRGVIFKTDCMWNFKMCNGKNELIIQRKLKEIEDKINQDIQNGMRRTAYGVQAYAKRRTDSKDTSNVQLIETKGESVWDLKRRWGKWLRLC